MTDLVAKEHHLQIEVVEETPTAEILNGLFPFIPVRHIQQTSLSERMHKGTMSQIVKHTVLRESGKVGTLIFQLLSQFACRGTVNHARCCFQVLNEMFAGKSVNQISVFILIPPYIVRREE